MFEKTENVQSKTLKCPKTALETIAQDHFRLNSLLRVISN